MSVTDHDTIAGLQDARHAAEAADITFIDGVELTAVHLGRDIHILAYFIDTASATLIEFLQMQRDRRTHRMREIAERLAAIGAPIDVDALLDRSCVAARKLGGTAAHRPRAGQGRACVGPARTRSTVFSALGKLRSSRGSGQPRSRSSNWCIAWAGWPPWLIPA